MYLGIGFLQLMEEQKYFFHDKNEFFKVNNLFIFSSILLLSLCFVKFSSKVRYIFYYMLYCLGFL